MDVLVLVVLILAMTGYTSANWCVCRSDVSDQALQKTLDYACGAGADCTPIIQNGACFQPNTLKNHCSYAVNSFFQKKGQAQGTCDFAGTAQVSTSDPSPGGSCAFPASAAAGTSTSPTTGTPTTGTPTTGTPTTGTPTTGTPTSTTPGSSTGTTPITGTPTSTTPGSSTGTTPSSTTGGIIGGIGSGSGLGPSGVGINSDSNDADSQQKNLFISLLPVLWFSGLFFLWG